MLRSDIITWVAKVSQRVQQLPKDATRLLLEETRLPVQQGGHMPVITGNLRNSAEVSLNGLPNSDKEYLSTQRLFDPTPQNNSKIYDVKLGGHIYIGFRAAYAPEAEIKHAFIRLAAQNWPNHVLEAIKLASASNP